MPCPDTPGRNWRAVLAAMTATLPKLIDAGVAVPDFGGLLRKFSDPPIAVPAEFNRDRQSGGSVEWVPVEDSAAEREFRRRLDEQYDATVERLRVRFRLMVLAGVEDERPRMPWEGYGDVEGEIPD